MTEALFDVPPDQVKRVRRTPPGTDKVTWGRYRPKKPERCDDCMQLLADSRGNAPAARTARWRRKEGGTDRLLCSGHMTARREDGGLNPLKDDRKAI